MKPASFEFARAGDLDEAIRLLGEDDSRPYAGGQSLGPMLNLRLVRPRLLVDISGVSDLHGFNKDGDGLEVGAGVVHADFEDGRVPDVANGLLSHAASTIAYRAVRNRGTIGGSLAHADPAADWPPVLMALDAVVAVVGPGGGREVGVGDLISGPLSTTLAQGEIIRSVRVPRLAADARWGHHKVSVKPGDFAESLAVVVTAPPLARVALAGPSSQPLRLKAVEGVVGGSGRWSAELGEEIRRTARDEIVAAGFVDESDGYAVRLHATAASRAAEEALGA